MTLLLSLISVIARLLSQVIMLAVGVFIVSYFTLSKEEKEESDIEPTGYALELTELIALSVFLYSVSTIIGGVL